MQKPLILCAAVLAATGCSAEPPRAEKSIATIDQRGEGKLPSRTPSDAALAKPDERMAIAVDSEGLRVLDVATGSARSIGFGTEDKVTIAGIEKLLGKARLNRNEECGAGPIDFSAFDGLTLHFQDGKFVGWALSAGQESDIGTINGIAIGTTRAQLEQAVPKLEINAGSTLGIEFYTGTDETNGLSGLLDGDGPGARITHMWAGTDCAFR